MQGQVVIIGGGILGTALTFYLARRGARSVLIEPGEIGAGTTSNSFAWANGTSKASDEAYHRLNASGMALYEDLAREYGEARALLRRTGALWVAESGDAGGLAAMRRDAAALARFGYAVEPVDGAALGRLEPGLSFAPGSEALLASDDMIVDAPAMARFFAAGAERLGARILRARAMRLLADEAGRVGGIETDAGEVAGDRVVLACGPETGEVLAELTGYDGFASRFPMRRVPGLLMTTPPLAGGGPARVVFTTSTRGMQMQPTRDGGVLLGADDIDALIWEDRSREAMLAAGARLIERAAQFLPGLARRVDPADCAYRVGIRPYPEDGLPLAGALPGAEGLFVLASHSGITLAPVLGALMAEELTTGARPRALLPYGLGRFAGFHP